MPLTNYTDLRNETEMITTKEIKNVIKSFKQRAPWGGYSHQIPPGESTSQHDKKFNNHFQRLSCNRILPPAI